MTKKKGRHRIFLRFVFSYAILLGIMLLVFGVAYTKMRSYTLSDAIEREQILLERGQTIVDERLREVDNVITQLSHSRIMQEFRSIESPIPDFAYFELLDLYANLPNYRLTNNFFSELLIYYPKSNAIISTFGATADPESFYGTSLEYQTMSFDQWKDRLNESISNANLWNSAEIRINGTERMILTYSRALTTTVPGNDVPVAAVFIDENRIFEYFMSVQPNSDEFMEIIDRSGMAIASYGVRASASEMDTLVLSVISPNTGLEYRLTKPLSGILTQVHKVRNLFLIVSSVALVLGLCAAVILSYQNSIPIRRVASHVSAWAGKDESRNESEYDTIEGTVSELLSQNSALAAEMEARLPLLRAGYLERLLAGGFATEVDAKAVLSYLNLNFNDQGYWVGIVRIAGHERELSKQDIGRVDSERLVVRQVLAQQLGAETYLHEKDTDKLILLIQATDYTIDRRFHRIIADAETLLSQTYGIHITCGVSDRRTRLVDAHAAMREAQLAIDHLERHADIRIHWYGNIPKRRAGYYYPIEVESRLFSLIRIGEELEAHALIDEIFQENFIDRSLPTVDIRQLMNEVQGTVCKLRDEVLVNGSRYKAPELNDIVSTFHTSSSADEFNESVKSSLTLLCKTVNERKRSHNVELVESIKLYLSAHFRDSNLTLYMVASHFELTETYLSQFFKEQTGENYSTFLEKTRIGEARRLLLEKELTVSDVAHHVGYMINSTFYRAFKRIYGVSPSTYREQMQQLDTDHQSPNTPDPAPETLQSPAL